MTTVLIFLAVLGFLVVMHELGHFVTAKLAKVKVLEFGVGFPPRLFGFTRGETTYTINALPLGGFVRMLGEEDPTDPRSFARQRPLTRLGILAAGAGVNAILPVFLLTAVFMLPQQVTVSDVTVMDVAPGSPAAEAGVQPGDFIREAQGDPLDNSTDLVSAIQARLGADMTWTIERQGESMEVRIPEVRADPPEGEGSTGIRLTDARLTLTDVTSGSTAADFGLMPGDRLLGVTNGGTGPDEIFARVLSESDFSTAVTAIREEEPDANIQAMVWRDGDIVSLAVPAAVDELSGVSVEALPEESRSQPIWQAVPSSIGQMWEILVVFRNEIGRMITGGGGLDIAGPVGIAQITGEIAGAGLSPLIMWTALLSINLAIINILPIPALDGGRITFVLLELIRGGRRLAPEKEQLVHLVGFALLITLIVVISINDIQRLLGGGSVTGG
ncbi:MAG: RIP metalloprotease RseP [Dehalococcoidia bacterium]